MKIVSRYFDLIHQSLNKQIDATGLAFFRIAYCAILMCEIGQIIYFRHLIYDKIPFIAPSEINFLPGLLVWLLSVLLILFGFYTRTAAVVNYVLSLVFIGTIKSYEYHVFYTYMGVNFLFLFLDISKTHSIDRLRRKIRYSSSKITYDPPTTVGAWHYFLPVAVGLGFVYFDSIFFKLASYNWINGLGMWLPASLPMATHVDLSAFLNIKWLAIGLGYLTVVFEFVFLFAFFLKKFRIPLLIVGVGLHLGITIIFPIPWFGMTALAVYLLMVPVSFWRKLGSRLRSKMPSFTVFYDKDCPLCNRARISFLHFDYAGKVEWKPTQEAGKDPRMESYSQETLLASMHGITKKGRITAGIDTYLHVTRRIPLLVPLSLLLSIPGIYHLANMVYKQIAINRTNQRCTDETCGYEPPRHPSSDQELKIFKNVNLGRLKAFGWGVLLFVLIVLQVNVTFHSKLVQDGLAKTGIASTTTYQTLMEYSRKVWGTGKILFGITRHGVFMDGHFEGYNHILAVEAEFNDGSRQWLPIIREDGSASWYDYSFLWVKWTFRVMDNHVNQENLRQGIRDFGTFWIYDNGYEIDQLKFNIYVKPVAYPKKWERDFLRNQKAKKWIKVGEGRWIGEEFVIDLPEIESVQ